MLENIFHSAINWLNHTLWNYILIYVLLAAGLYFTIRFGFLQWRVFQGRPFQSEPGALPSSISSYQAFATGLASRVGTGNIVGVALALSLGGPGAIFWMWVVALLGMSSAFVEATLAQIFKHRTADGGFRGGPSYYIRTGLRSRWLSVAFALSLILAFGFVFNAAQAQSIAEAMDVAFGVPRHVAGATLVLLTAPVIFGGARRVARLASLIVPIMAIAYLGLTGYVLFTSLSELPALFGLIFRSAFGMEQAASGLSGFAVSQAMATGLKRGLFSNEAGMGSAPNAAAAAVNSHPVSQGLLQMLGVLIDTLVICTATAFLILLSGEYAPTGEIQGASLTHAAMTAHLGEWGGIALAVAIFFFAYSTVLGNYAYAETNIQFLSSRSKVLMLFRLLVLGMVMFGSIGSLPLVWSLADTSMAVMALINLTAIVLLSHHAHAAWQDYLRQRRNGVARPVFTRDTIPALRDRLPEQVW